MIILGVLIIIGFCVCFWIGVHTENSYLFAFSALMAGVLMASVGCLV